MLELLGLLLGTFRVALGSRRTVLLENLVLRQHLAVALRPRRRPRLTRRDRLFLLLVRRLTADWRRHLVLVSPDTVVRWHRQGWRLFWRWQSRTRLGRPRLLAEVRELIATMSPENERAVSPWRLRMGHGHWSAASSGRPSPGLRASM